MTILKLATEMERKGKDVIYAAESIMSTKVPEPVLDFTKKHMKSQTLVYYTPFSGVDDLRKAVAKRFENLYGQKVDWESQIVTSNGSMEAEFHLMHALLDPEDEVIIPIPGFVFNRPAELYRSKASVLPTESKEQLLS